MSGCPTDPQPQPLDVREYIEEMLAQLADLAAARGERRLATTLRMTALEAARQPEQA
jgi:hypothetical protein